MKITNFKSVRHGDRARVAATITWEDCDRPQRDIYFETDEQFVGGLWCNPDAFLLSAIMPAAWHGERRISVEGPICPLLRDGLKFATRLIAHWYQRERKDIQIEASARSSALGSAPAQRTAFFFTGGIDSLATLRTNRLTYPPTHPMAAKEGIFVFGLYNNEPNVINTVASYLSPIAEDAALTFVPVYTNARFLEDDWGFWADVSEAAILSATVHIQSRRLTQAFIGSSFDIPNLHPHGSHPLLDPCYSSQEVAIRHDSAAVTRLEKTRLLAEWEVALQRIRVCNMVDSYRADQFNCGKCEKCLRTMLSLYIWDALEKTSAFPRIKLTEEFVRETAELNGTSYRFWPELIAPLKAKGRADLARGIRYALDRYYGETGLAGPFKRLDRVLFKDSLRQLKRKVVAKRRKSS